MVMPPYICPLHDYASYGQIYIGCVHAGSAVWYPLPLSLGYSDNSVVTYFTLISVTLFPDGLSFASIQTLQYEQFVLVVVVITGLGLQLFW